MDVIYAAHSPMADGDPAVSKKLAMDKHATPGHNSKKHINDDHSFWTFQNFPSRNEYLSVKHWLASHVT